MEDYEEEEEKHEDWFVGEDGIDDFFFPMTKEDVLKAFNELNNSGQNWVYSKIKAPK